MMTRNKRMEINGSFFHYVKMKKLDFHIVIGKRVGVMLRKVEVERD